MRLPPYLFLGLFAFTIALTSCATSGSMPAQVQALRESQGRVVEYKRARESLGQMRARKQIETREYSAQQDQLDALIQQEGRLQTAIVQGDPQVPTIADNLLHAIGTLPAIAAGARPVIVVGNLSLAEPIDFSYRDPFDSLRSLRAGDAKSARVAKGYQIKLLEGTSSALLRARSF